MISKKYNLSKSEINDLILGKNNTFNLRGIKHNNDEKVFLTLTNKGGDIHLRLDVFKKKNVLVQRKKLSDVFY